MFQEGVAIITTAVFYVAVIVILKNIELVPAIGYIILVALFLAVADVLIAIIYRLKQREVKNGNKNQKIRKQKEHYQKIKDFNK